MEQLGKIAFVSDYVPRKCGIATFTHDIRTALASQYAETDCIVVPVNDTEEGYAYPPEVRFEFPERDPRAYRQAADFLNFNNVDVVSLQHEFGIYGGPEGRHILGLVRDLRVPVATTLHTVLREPTPDQRQVTVDLTALSARLIVMTQKGRELLAEVYGVDRQKIDVIPHGIPDMPFYDPSFYQDQYGVKGKKVLLTFGLLSPNKGIEYALRALPAIREAYAEVVYIVLGTTHPNTLREQGELYRLSLELLAKELGVQKNVIFYDRFVAIEELKQFLAAADIYITPYLFEAQITSGTLAYAFGCGKAVISTPYWHAAELLAEDRGVLVPFRDPDAIGKAVISLFDDDRHLQAMRERAYRLGREMVWSNIAQRYVESFIQARRSHQQRPRVLRTMDAIEERGAALPRLRLDHLIRLSDGTGLLQHAHFTLPRLEEGYCTDDNARALIFAVLIEDLDEATPELARLAVRYAAFLDHAFDRRSGWFRNFMSFDRRWIEEARSDDAHARAVWALAICFGRSKQPGLQHWAAELFPRAVAAIPQSEHPRAWAFGLLGIHEYLRRLPGDRAVAEIRDDLVARLLAAYERHSAPEWRWFDNMLTYANGRLPQALLVAARSGADASALDIGLASLDWLTRVHTEETGYFRPVGSEGFYPRGARRAHFDQQPLEAWAAVSASIEAFRATDDRRWLKAARTSFEWFLGRNDLGMPLYDPATGGCRDALHVDRTNKNQGAESTLAFLLSLAEMRLLQEALRAFDRPEENDRVATGALENTATAQGRGLA